MELCQKAEKVINADSFLILTCKKFTVTRYSAGEI